MNSETTSWTDWNQQQLLGELAGIKRLLSGEAAGPQMDPTPGSHASALDVLARLAGLSSFERSLLLLCAGPELDSEVGRLIARRTDTAGHPAPTAALAMAILPGAHWSALSPQSPLRRWRFLEVGAGPLLVESPLRLDERILHYICGINTMDERLLGFVSPAGTCPPLAPSHLAAVDSLERTLKESSHLQLVHLLGSSASVRRSVAAAACARFNLGLYRLNARHLPDPGPESESVARLWERESALSGAVLLIELGEADPVHLSRATGFIEQVECLVFTAGTDPLPGVEKDRVCLDLPELEPREARTLWLTALGPEKASMANGQVEAVVQQFRLDASAIHELAVRFNPDGQGPRDLWLACRKRTRAPMEALAQRIETHATWEDLVLPREAMRTLREIPAHLRRRYTVYEEWGFAARHSRGLGINALFSGPSGTGKTLAAEVIANELELDLFRIDLSSVVNKYIGETEKNLRRVFDAAEASGAILLFDEADALFGKRSDVRDSHDRYANIEVGYLLQRMEAYRGLAILTTNMRHSLDGAFLRRLRFVVNFPFPDAVNRAEIWRRVFPDSTPTDNLDPAKLARLNVSGGHIRNIALGAAVLAADSSEPVRMKHLLQAARSECQKLDRTPSEAELGGWV